MSIKNYDFKFVFTAEQADTHRYDDDEIIIAIKACLIPPDTAGEHIDINEIINAFEKISFPRPTFKYGIIEAVKEISFSEFCREWDLEDPFGLQLIYDKTQGYSFNLHSPRDVIPKER